jgi:hypothetical protein
MTRNSNNGQIRSDDDKENKMFAANAPSNPKSTSEDFVPSSPNPEQGSDDTTDSGPPLSPGQLFCERATAVGVVPNPISLLQLIRLSTMWIHVKKYMKNAYQHSSTLKLMSHSRVCTWNVPGPSME